MLVLNICRRAYSTVPQAAEMVDSVLARRVGGYDMAWDGAGCYQNAKERPKILRTYLQVAEEVHDRGQIPLVHGQSSAAAISQRVLPSNTMS